MQDRKTVINALRHEMGIDSDNNWWCCKANFGEHEKTCKNYQEKSMIEDENGLCFIPEDDETKPNPKPKRPPLDMKKLSEMSQMERKPVICNKKDSVAIVEGCVCKLQIPAQIVLDVDTITSHLLRLGNVAPELRLYIGRTENGKGPLSWKCEIGGVTTEGLTPYSALQMMAKIIRGEPL